MKKNTRQSNKGTGKSAAPAVMDPDIPEVPVPVPVTNNARVCYAIETLVSEVHELFGPVPVEYSEVNGRNTALAATFDLTVLDEGVDRTDAASLIALVEEDPRVKMTITGGGDKSGQAYVEMHSHPVTQDTRDRFGLAEALEAMREGPVVYDDEDDDFEGGSL